MHAKYYLWTACSMGCGLILVIVGLIFSFLPKDVETNVLLFEHR